MTVAGWYAVGLLGALVILYAARSFYWRCRCAEFEARYDVSRRTIDRLYDDLREARSVKR